MYKCGVIIGILAWIYSVIIWDISWICINVESLLEYWLEYIVSLFKTLVWICRNVESLLGYWFEYVDMWSHYTQKRFCNITVVFVVV